MIESVNKQWQDKHPMMLKLDNCKIIEILGQKNQVACFLHIIMR